ncbi:hypothetical protein J6590_022504 [Homalodisca vitripennis]|nr:hypothetical protein J6590_022504 [Homalodisca vitripennis]
MSQVSTSYAPVSMVEQALDERIDDPSVGYDAVKTKAILKSVSRRPATALLDRFIFKVFISGTVHPRAS